MGVSPRQLSTANKQPSTNALLKSRVVKHSPNEMGEWDGDAERIDVLKALKEIQWFLNSNPRRAADEDYASIQKYVAAYDGTVNRDNLFVALCAEAQADGNYPQGDHFPYTCEMDKLIQKGRSASSSESSDDTASWDNPRYTNLLKPQTEEQEARG